MNKKKVKRVSARRSAEGAIAPKWRRFCDAGGPVSVILLGLFVAAASFLLSLGQAHSLQADRAYWPPLKSVLQVGALMAVLSLAMALYIRTYEPRIVSNHLRGVVLAALLLLMTAAIRLIVVEGWTAHLIAAPVLALAILLTIGYSQRFALGMAAFAVLIAAVALQRQNPAVLVSVGSSTALAVLSLKEIRSRSRLIEVCFLAGLVVAVVVWAAGFWQADQLPTILKDSLWGGGAALAVGFVMQGILPMVERLFRTATGMTLQDYAEANTPLLKRLAVAAPGTFNHSWQIGMLTEAAAEAIGANGLLCRVGSYYHDVGKLNKPRYFVENQADDFNQHKELSPTMSRMIIVGHVKDGLELAREYRLPRILHQFIDSHHGTTLVAYFYHEAAKKGAQLGQSVPEQEFRYPGPKPRTRETAILMLADAAEGAIRSMSEPTPSRIEAVVNEMAMSRLQDGQFDECDLTMRDLKRIELSLTKSLCGMYHGRVAYPKPQTPVANGNGAESDRPASLAK